MADLAHSSVGRRTVLERIMANLNQARQWSERQDWALAAHHAAKAEGLVELLEIDDCGSVGGFDVRRGQNRLRAAHRLEDRVYWLLSVGIADD